VSTAVPGTTFDDEGDEADEGDDGEEDEEEDGTVAGVDAGRAMSAVPVEGW
jgi:hypothetical protein